jgi:hypothetical protein
MQIREILEGSHPGRTYSTKLLSRTIGKGKETHFGADPHCMTQFLESGFTIRINGGVFQFHMNQLQQLVTVLIQVSGTFGCFTVS